MTAAFPTPENRLTLLADAVTSAERTISGLQSAIRLAEIDPQIAIALIMLAGDIEMSVRKLRTAQAALDGGLCHAGLPASYAAAIATQEEHT